MLVLASTMLLAPIATSSAHTTALQVDVSDQDTHGHDDALDRHDQIEHLHDVPHMQSPTWTGPVPPPPSWQALGQWSPADVELAGLERPPRR